MKESESGFEFSLHRQELLAELEAVRGSRVIVYVDRGQEVPEGLLRQFFEHIRDMHNRTLDRLDLVLWCRGRHRLDAQRTELDVARRLIALFREYTRELSILVPHEGYGLATLLAMGADHVVMHPMASLGKLVDTTTLAEWFALLELGEQSQRSQALAENFLAHTKSTELAGVRDYQHRFARAVQDMVAQRVVRKKGDWLESLSEALEEGTLAGRIGRRRAKHLGFGIGSQNADVQDVLWRLFASYEHALGPHEVAAIESGQLAQVYDREIWRCVVESAH